MNQQTPPTNVNWQAIHGAYADYKAKSGPSQTSRSPMPQPEHNGPGYAMLIHAMSKAPHEVGQDHGTMIIRALDQHLKRITPDVSAIHKESQPQGRGGGGYC